MGILFVIALLLAWPTFGLSIVVWLVVVFFKSKSKVDKVNRRDEVKAVIEPMFQGQLGEFFMALDMPILHGRELTGDEAQQCGRHVLNYLAHNPEEAALFVSGLERWRTKGGASLCSPVEAAESEKDYDEKGEIHLTSYRAVEAVMTNNRNVACFKKIDFGRIIQYRSMLELKGIRTAA